MKKWCNTGTLWGIATLLVISLQTLAWGIPVFIIAVCKLIPIPRWQTLMTRAADAIAVRWMDINGALIRLTQPVKWEIHGLENIDKNARYLLVANHQSWLDIVVLQFVFNRKIAVLKFFIKDSLKWMPVLGFAWWAMGCPFMKRYSKAYLAKHPHKKGEDFRATQKAVKIFSKCPGTITSFVEGTRFTPLKQETQKAPYQHLLKPRAGGVSFVIRAMEEHLDAIIDASIAYPAAHYSLWDFLCHRVKSVKVHVRVLPIPEAFSTMTPVDEQDFQETFRAWLNGLWEEKDRLVASMKNEGATSLS